MGDIFCKISAGCYRKAGKVLEANEVVLGFSTWDLPVQAGCWESFQRRQRGAERRCERSEGCAILETSLG